jgi:hypothetical protein
VTRIEPFRAEDAPAVAALHAQAFPEAPWSSEAARAAYFRDVLLGSPWSDPALPSLVARDGERLAGFFGVMPRRMRCGERSLRVAVGCQFMVDPRCRDGLLALRLMRAFLAGPQDLSVADGANEASRALWVAAGGISSALQELHWLLLLRPAQSLWQRAARRRPALGALGAPLAALADACVARLLAAAPDRALRREPLDARGLLAALEETRRGFALRPDYDLASLEWLLAQAAAKKRHGELHGALVRDARGIAGWYLYYFGRATSQVLQIGARREAAAAVLGCLVREARERGALALEGRVEPALAAALAASSCLLQSRGSAVLLHAREAELLLPFLRGDAFFSRLDGEWWLRFSGDAAAPGAGGRSAGRGQHSRGGALERAAQAI